MTRTRHLSLAAILSRDQEPSVMLTSALEETSCLAKSTALGNRDAPLFFTYSALRRSSMASIPANSPHTSNLVDSAPYGALYLRCPIVASALVVPPPALAITE